MMRVMKGIFLASLSVFYYYQAKLDEIILIIHLMVVLNCQLNILLYDNYKKDSNCLRIQSGQRLNITKIML